MNRRGFLTRSGLALGAIIVGDEVLETLDRLTHRKVWAGHAFSPFPTLADIAKIHGDDYTQRAIAMLMRRSPLFESIPMRFV